MKLKEIKQKLRKAFTKSNISENEKTKQKINKIIAKLNSLKHSKYGNNIEKQRKLRKKLDKLKKNNKLQKKKSPYQIKISPLPYSSMVLRPHTRLPIRLRENYIIPNKCIPKRKKTK